MAGAVVGLSLLTGCALAPNTGPATTAPPLTDVPAPVSVLPTASALPTLNPPPTPGPGSGSPSTSTTPDRLPTATFSPRPTTAPTTTGTGLAPSFARFASTQPGRLAVAVTAVGETTTPVSLGQLGSPVAWSTSKVPVAIAVERTGRATGLRSTMRSAITASDNEAAVTLWQSLGTPAQAAAATDEVLRDYGDATTRTQSEQIRPPYTAFGQTRWSLSDQARFGATLPCRTEAAPVYDAMGRIIPDQRWGLGVIPNSHFKGGWGPSATGYLVRQVGVIDTPRGQVAVALAVESPSFQQGTATLSRTAEWLQSQAAVLPAGRC